MSVAPSARSVERLGTGGDESEADGRHPKVNAEVAAANARWVRDLTSEGDTYDHAVGSLYGTLLRMAYAEASRKGARIDLAGPELDDIAHQAAADVTMMICRKVSTFRGESRFTTWAYKFVVFDVSAKVNRHFWQRAHVSIDDNDWAAWDADGSGNPAGFAEGTDLMNAVRRIIRDDLTLRQQRAFEAIAFQGIPVSQVAAELNSNANAIYKTMFDARNKLRIGLRAAGYLENRSA